MLEFYLFVKYTKTWDVCTLGEGIYEINKNRQL